MKKKITAKLYTETKTAWKNHEHIIIRNKDGALFSQMEYRTKILPSDLPEWYVAGYFYRHKGYLLAKGVKHMVYQPNSFSNHIFKDDFLYVSYNKPIKPVSRDQSIFQLDGFDEYIWGWNIIYFLKAVEQYSGFDISNIKAEVEEKRIWFKETFPEFYHLEVHADDIFNN